MMTEQEASDFAERMKAARDAKAAEREAAGDELEPDATPQPKGKSTRRRRRKATTRRAPSSKPASLRVPLRTMFETVGNVWHMSESLRGHVPIDENYPTCGSVLVAQADDLAINLNTLAQSDPNVYRWLDRMMTGGGWGGVVLSAWPIAQAVLYAHIMPTLNRRRELGEEPAEEPTEGPWPGQLPT